MRTRLKNCTCKAVGPDGIRVLKTGVSQLCGVLKKVLTGLVKNFVFWYRTNNLYLKTDKTKKPVVCFWRL